MEITRPTPPFEFPKLQEQNGAFLLKAASFPTQEQLGSMTPAQLKYWVDYNRTLALGGPLTHNNQKLTTPGVVGAYKDLLDARIRYINESSPLKKDQNRLCQVWGIDTKKRALFDGVITLEECTDPEKARLVQEGDLIKALNNLEITIEKTTPETIKSVVQQIYERVAKNTTSLSYFEDYRKLRIGYNSVLGIHIKGIDEIQADFEEAKKSAASQACLSAQALEIDKLTSFSCQEQKQEAEKIAQFLLSKMQLTEEKATALLNSYKNAPPIEKEEKARKIRERVSPQYTLHAPDLPSPLKKAQEKNVAQKPVDPTVLSMYYPRETETPKNAANTQKVLSEIKPAAKDLWTEDLVDIINGNGVVQADPVVEAKASTSEKKPQLRDTLQKEIKRAKTTIDLSETEVTLILQETIDELTKIAGKRIPIEKIGSVKYEIQGNLPPRAILSFEVTPKEGSPRTIHLDIENEEPKPNQATSLAAQETQTVPKPPPKETLYGVPTSPVGLRMKIHDQQELFLTVAKTLGLIKEEGYNQIQDALRKLPGALKTLTMGKNISQLQVTSTGLKLIPA